MRGSSRRNLSIALEDDEDNLSMHIKRSSHLKANTTPTNNYDFNVLPSSPINRTLSDMDEKKLNKTGTLDAVKNPNKKYRYSKRMHKLKFD